MKMKKYIQSMMAFAAIVSFASCSSEDNTTIENESATKLMTFTATQEGDEQSTRAAISTDNKKVIVWKSGDQISIFDGTENNKFTLKDGAGTKSATFQGEAATTATYTAVYPYTAGANYDTSNGTVTGITLKATQAATDNSFDKEAALMIAEGDKNTLSFKNVVGYVKVKPNFDCKRIDLKAFDNSAVLAGTGTVSYNGGEPTLDLSSAPKKDYAITLQGDIKEGKYYYIAVPPVTLKAGWTIKFTASNGTVYSRKGNNDITFTRNKVIDLGEFDIDGSYWYNPRGTKVTPEQEVDLGLTINIGTKNYKVIFANANLRATLRATLTDTGLAEKETDYGDYFAWGAISVWYSSINKASSPWTITPIDGKSGGYKNANAPFYDSPTYEYTKYTIDNTLEASDDAANVILGGDWQLPTKDIWVALYKANKNTVNWGDNGNRKLETISGINGMRITKINDTDTYLFLPAAGFVTETSFKYVGSYGYYWSGSARSSGDAYCLSFNSVKSVKVNAQDNYLRRFGFSVRPVRLVAE
ncbi:MAG: hypothetical protein MR717_10370 [Prevotella sp.]|nr:hypothetical protein [Prevotella sp.]